MAGAAWSISWHEQDLSSVGRGSGLAAAAFAPRFRAGGPSGASAARAGAQELDLTALMARLRRGAGPAAVPPAMMVALLLYAFSRGLYASRRIARACEQRLDFMAVTGMQRPDFRTISDFRKRHLAALAALFVQVLRPVPGGRAGQARPRRARWHPDHGQRQPAQGDVLRPDAPGRGRAHDRGRGLAGQGRAADAAGDAEHGEHGAATRCPSGWRTSRRDCERIRAAKAALEAKARADPPPTDAAPGPSSGMSDHGRPRRAKDGGPPEPGAAELHRSRQPHPEDQKRLYPRLQRPARGRCRPADHRGPPPDHQRQ